MPRSGRRGVPSQEGAPAGAYPASVSQAAQSATQPVRTPTGIGYGEAGALEAAQQQFPLPAGPSSAAPQLMPGTMTP
jgi:hypothetical protein